MVSQIDHYELGWLLVSPYIFFALTQVAKQWIVCNPELFDSHALLGLLVIRILKHHLFD